MEAPDALGRAYPTCRPERGETKMASLGAAIGIVLSLAVLAISIWEFPRIRRAFFSDWNAIVAFVIGTALLGGWIGHKTFAILVHP